MERPLRAVRGVVFGDHTHEAVALDQADVVVAAGASHRELRGELLDRERLLDQGSEEPLSLGMAGDLQRFDMSTCVRRTCPFYTGWRALQASSAITSRSLRTPRRRFPIVAKIGVVENAARAASESGSSSHTADSGSSIKRLTISSACCVPLVTTICSPMQSMCLRARRCAAIASRKPRYPAGSPNATSSREG